MSDTNYLVILFSLKIMCIIVMSSLVNSFERYLPGYILRCFRYGKFSYKNKLRFNPIEVPKSWFKHMYVYSSILSVAAEMLMIATFIFNVQLPIIIYKTLDSIAGSNRQARISNTSAFLAMTLLTIQCLRRLYDTQYVSVFSKSARMNLVHYLLGFPHYTGAILAIAVESPRFIENTSHEFALHWKDLSWMDGIATLLFIWSWWHQYKVTKILSNLRKDRKGAIVTEAYKLPYGDWFKYVSSPHSLAEILMYFALTIILWNNITWIYVFIWVLSNQVETSLLSHWWYQETFKDFPKNRKAVIPFIY